MVTLDDLQDLRPEGIDFEFDGHATSIMPTAQTRRLGLGVPDVKLDWQVLIDGYIVGYIERGQDVILAWNPSQLDDGSPAQVTNIEEALQFLAPLKPPQHKHGKHHGKK
ncbi:hypothetical protein B0I08_101634 [Glaciihabitans tibetensis]|uniref:Uncharacterized protein n=1 Tax=Glaciihabitans tibetensis TaxID=1266600 RepID=A0A2T0VJW0_9MICO|nr:hypothetical protein [Glaciihabitans tibetensis]PRY70498.1 hypothetical protein B0I08_101634 [Glaciihabitans tibetensis]